MSRTLSRKDRAERLRPHVQDAVTGLSWRGAAEEIGVSTGAIRNLLSGSIPHPDTLERIEAWALRKGLLTSESNGRKQSTADQAEEWLSRIANPDMLRRQAGTPTGRDLILGIKSFLFELDWPLEEKNAVDALLNRIAADAEEKS